MVSASQRSPHRRSLLVATATLQIALALLLAHGYLSAHNTLHNNGNWVSTKATLARGVMGAQAFVFELQPLAHGYLNLAAWHGFQEIVTREAFDPASVEFRFFLEANSLLSVFFREPDGRSTGIRLSKTRRYPSMLYSAAPDGEFTRKAPFKKLGRFTVGEWHRARLELEGGKLSLFLDDRNAKTLPVDLQAPLRIGFRGTRRMTLLDDIRIVDRDGDVLYDSFGRPGDWPAVVGAALALVLGLSAALFLLLRRLLPVGETLLFAYFLMFTGVLLVLGAMWLGFASYTKAFYPDRSEKLAREEEYWQESSEARVYERIEQGYSQAPAPDTVRIVFLGSSQTHGSGAARESETLVRRTEAILNERSGDRRFECVNTAVHGHRLARMARNYLERWIELEPDIVVVNASNNDIGYGVGKFRRRLVEVIDASRERGIEVVLVMEPNSPERNPKLLGEFHEVMAQLGARYGLRVVDMHAHLSERRDDGFLWWDWVHLTSFGQRLFAERLAEELADLVLEGAG